jgi:hypothetical protein
MHDYVLCAKDEIMVKVTFNNKTMDVSSEKWPQFKNALDKYFEGLKELESLSAKQSIPLEISTTTTTSQALTPIVSTNTRTLASLQNMAGFRPPTEKTIIDYAIDALKVNGTWVTLDVLIETMQACGWRTTAKTRPSINSTVRNSIRDRSDAIARYGNAWGLKEWEDIVPEEKSDFFLKDEDASEIITISDMFPNHKTESSTDDLSDPFADDDFDPFADDNTVNTNNTKSKIEGSKYGIGPNFGRTL